jgi:hypothetical protein
MLLQQLAKTDHQQDEDHYAFTCSAVKTLQEEYAFACDAFLEHAGIKKSIADSGTGSTCQISVTSSLLSNQWFLAYDPSKVLEPKTSHFKFTVTVQYKSKLQTTGNGLCHYSERCIFCPSARCQSLLYREVATIRGCLVSLKVLELLFSWRHNSFIGSQIR